MNDAPDPDAQTVLDFWFGQVGPKGWWKKDSEFDRLIARQFGSLHARARAGECFPWRETSLGRLAEIIVLDQFSRNIFRDSDQAFTCDGMALVLAQEAVALGWDSDLSPEEKAFLYMPYMHSESPQIHKIAIELFSREGLENNLDFEKRHKEIIDRFGRYPHRNEILGRKSTPEEALFLQQPGSSF